MPLILASTSPRRRQLLADHGYAFRAVPPPVIREVTPAHLTPGETVLYNARTKAEAVAPRYPFDIVLGVDTLVACDGQIFGKPQSMDEALATLRRLNGRTHEVFSGVWLVHVGTRRQRGFIEVTRVRFRRLTIPRLRRYLERVDPLDKAGGYAAQEDDGELIERVEGSFTNVIGLPMEKLTDALRRFDGKRVALKARPAR